MDWITGMNEAIDYIEQHITEPVEVGKAADVAGCSLYHFQRMFAYIANVPLSEYIRRRRMTLAAVDLQSGEKIIDVALKYGYESPTAFNRAFKSVHGEAPSKIKRTGTVIKAFPRISFSISVHGGSELNYRIEKKDEFRIVGIRAELDTDLEKNFATVPKMWMKAALFGTVRKLVSLQNNPLVPGILGVSFPESSDRWSYYISTATDRETGKKFEERTVPSFTWAVFPGKGPSREIQELERRIVTEWLPSSGYEYDNGPDVEVYITPDPKCAEYEVWIPIVRKS